MDTALGPDWIALLNVWARIPFLGTAASATDEAAHLDTDWTLMAHVAPAVPVQFSVRSICLRRDPESASRTRRRRRDCTFDEGIALGSLADARRHGPRRRANPRPVYFITAVAGRRARLEQSLQLHRRNAVEFGDGTSWAIRIEHG